MVVVVAIARQSARVLAAPAGCSDPPKKQPARPSKSGGSSRGGSSSRGALPPEAALPLSSLRSSKGTPSEARRAAIDFAPSDSSSSISGSYDSSSCG